MKRNQFSYLVMLVAASSWTLGPAPSAQAVQDYYWSLPAGQSGDWSIPSNWGGVEPTSNDTANVINGGTVTRSLKRPNAHHLSPRIKMRDRRFVAAHRGGPLDKDSHIVLARWAADCAEGVLHFFALASDDQRPKRAIETAREWANGEVKTGVAMKASVASHAAARETTDKAAKAAARAAGQAVATAHFADHCMGALLYGLKSLEAAGLDADAELKTRLDRLPDHLRELVEAGVFVRLPQLGIRATLAR